jgi:hypothetical protein
MRKFSLILLFGLAGCHSDLSESRVERDFREVVKSKYPAVKVESVERVAFGDGWDDGVEVKLYFKGVCDRAVVSRISDQFICTSDTQPMQMEISYQRDSGGSWQVLATTIQTR